VSRLRRPHFCGVRSLGSVRGRTLERRRAALRHGGSRGSKPQSFGMIAMVTGLDLRARGYGTGGLAGIVSWVGMELLVGSG
jgi:hypothetical protein